MNTTRVGISIGDINGIGLEVILKTLSDPRVLDRITPVLYGSSKVVNVHLKKGNYENLRIFSVDDVDKVKPGKINVLESWVEDVKVSFGELNEDGGKYAVESLISLTTDMKTGKLDAMVTAPFNKKAIQLSGFDFPGHTEYLTQTFESLDSVMLLVSDSLRVGVVTGHVPLSKVSSSINKALILNKIKILEKTLRVDFGIDKPKIAVLGLNPHAGDEGVLGEEEIKTIRPSIVEMKKRGMMVFGPFAADGFFGSGNFMKYDGILAMYHDQGLVPFKALSFGKGVNYTAGLPVVRTSPDHGTGFDIAGKGIANPDSFRKALFLAVDIAKNRKNFEEMTENPLKRANRKKSKDGAKKG